MFTWLTIEFRSSTTLGGGGGMPGVVDTDVEFEPSGLPMIGGRRIKGLLVEESAVILRAFSDEAWDHAASELFGIPGRPAAPANARIGDAHLPAVVRQAAADAVAAGRVRPEQLLASLTEIRSQTAVDAVTGAPSEGSLRRNRAVRRGLRFYSRVSWTEVPDDRMKALYACCVLALRRGGLARTRGRGALTCRCLDDQMQDLTFEWARPLLQEGGITWPPS